MISVGIDVSKGKSMICILKPSGEVLKKPYELRHKIDELSQLLNYLASQEEPFRIILESTGHYHMPLVKFFSENGVFISIVNPIVLHKFANTEIRKAKTDKKDSIKIAEYGLLFWHKLCEYKLDEDVYSELKNLSRQYYQYLNLRIKAKNNLNNLLDNTMPEITKHLEGPKLLDFVKKFWHYDTISSNTFSKFNNSYKTLCSKRRYNYSESKSQTLYQLAKYNIPIYNSSFPSTKAMILASVNIFEEISKSSNLILEQMQSLAKTLPEYDIVRAMNGVGDKLACRLISEIGNVNKFHSAKALIAYAGIDAPPYQSGQFYGTKRKISKRGSKYLRKTGYEVMQALKRNKPTSDNKVYEFIIKKENEGKPKRVAKIAGLNKFLRIYYARAKEIYN